jgi:uncharacterized protein YdaU (DUF1376 family)
MNYYPHHIGDYRSATMHLSNEEDLAYRRLLEMYYDTERPIPLETQWVARRLRVDSQALQSVLTDFFVQTEEGWKHSKCDFVIREYQEMAEKNRKNGKLGGRPKSNKQAKENPVGSQSVASGNPVETHWKGNQEPRTNNQEPKRESRAVALSCPPDVNPQVWADWLHLRKTKKASVTETVVNGARAEAQKAGLPLQAFLEIWCLRGSQGLQADWIKPDEKNQALSKTGQMNQRVMSGLTRGLIGGTGNVKLLGK